MGQVFERLFPAIFTRDSGWDRCHETFLT